MLENGFESGMSNKHLLQEQSIMSYQQKLKVTISREKNAC